jgi:hypothetical protein
MGLVKSLFSFSADIGGKGGGPRGIVALGMDAAAVTHGGWLGFKSYQLQIDHGGCDTLKKEFSNCCRCVTTCRVYS